MGRLSKGKSRQRWMEARNLWNEWDPIGVFFIDEAWPRDEYESYVGPTLRLLEQGASADQITEHLDGVAVDRMGLAAYPDAHEFAERLRAWYAGDWLGTEG